MIEGVVYAALASLVNSRCYPVTFPQTDAVQAWPAIRYAVVDAVNEPTICGTDAVDTDSTRVQIDVCAKTHGAAVALRDQVITALMSTDPPCVRDGSGFQTYDTETKVFRVTLDYLFHASSSGS